MANWIKDAVKHPGALTEKAKRAGESTMEFAREHAHDPGQTGRQARLALTLRSFHKPGSGSGSGSGSKRYRMKGEK